MDINNYMEFMENDKPLDDKDIIHNLSVATTHIIYRNGPVEDMHADGKLTDYAMMNINKFMVNRLGGIFLILLDNKKVDLIKKCGEYYIENLIDIVIEYCFIDGILNTKIDIEKLTDKDIDIIVEFMNQKLYPILLIILERNINGIKGILSNSFIYGRYWYYCKPDIIDFDLFLEKLDY